MILKKAKTGAIEITIQDAKETDEEVYRVFYCYKTTGVIRYHGTYDSYDEALEAYGAVKDQFEKDTNTKLTE